MSTASPCGTEKMNKQPSNEQDIKLCYFGGSGGFIVLHLLLLSGRFVCQFKDTSKTLLEIINDQWQIGDALSWKAKEHWPDNALTKNFDTTQRKIYFFCNPTKDMLQDFDGLTLLLYLGADAHIKLMHHKRAYYFFGIEKRYQNLVSYYRDRLKPWIHHYNAVKDPSWPRCTGPAGFRALPAHIQTELLKNDWTAKHLDIKTHEPLPEVTAFLQHVDKAINLTDIMNDLNLLSSISGVPVNQAQKDLRQRWLALHPSCLLDNIGIQPIWEAITHAEQP